MKCICQIVCHNLFNFKLIPQNLQMFRDINLHPGFILLKQDAGGIYQITYQLRPVKGFYGRHVSSEFQSCQSQKLFYHLIHLIGFIHNDFTVIISALLILAHSLGQSLGISLNQGNGRFQLMGYVGNKLLSHFINLRFFLDIMLKLLIGLLKGSYGFLQLIRKGIHTAPQNSDFILTAVITAYIKIQF